MHPRKIRAVLAIITTTVKLTLYFDDQFDVRPRATIALGHTEKFRKLAPGLRFFKGPF